MPKEKLAEPSAHGAYNYREAFCLMWYGCKTCGHHERMWNSRDGVTPFGAQCPSCGTVTLMHVNWELDRCVPNHVPHLGQRVWMGMTKEHAEKMVQRVTASYVAARNRELSKDEQAKLLDSFWQSGESPMMVITGYLQI